MKTLSKIILAIACCLPAGAVALADDPSADALRQRILDEQNDSERRVVGLGRVRLSVPQRLSGSLGAMITRQPARYDCTSVCEYRGWLVQAEPGISGGQLSVGWASLNAEKDDNDFFLSKVFLGWGVRAALLRTWGNADLNPSDQTLLGAEAGFTVIRVNFSLGLFRHVSGGDPSRDWVITGGLGWGF